MAAENLNNTELLDLMQAVKTLMGQNFSVRQAFDIAVTRAGWISRISYSVFSSNVSDYAKQIFSDKGQLAAVARWIETTAPKVVSGAAWWRYQARLGGARLMGWLGPRAARRVVIRQAGKKGAAIIIGTVVTGGTVALLIWTWTAYDVYKDVRDAGQEAPHVVVIAPTSDSTESSGGFHKGDMQRVDPRFATYERSHGPNGREIAQGNGVFLTSWWSEGSRKVFCTIEAYGTDAAARAFLQEWTDLWVRSKDKSPSTRVIQDAPTSKSVVSERRGVWTGEKRKPYRDESLFWHCEIYRGRFVVQISGRDDENITDNAESRTYMENSRKLIDLRFPK